MAPITQQLIKNPAFPGPIPLQRVTSLVLFTYLHIGHLKNGSFHDLDPPFGQVVCARAAEEAATGKHAKVDLHLRAHGLDHPRLSPVPLHGQRDEVPHRDPEVDPVEQPDEDGGFGQVDA